jgi:thioesterase domain-containing protein
MAGVILNEGLPETSSSIIPLQSHGSGVPLFWTSGSFFMRHLEPDQPAYILISWEEHGFLPVFSTVEEIASHCIKRMLAERPEGPYALGGYCIFGVIALEMARQLKKLDHEVPLLFLVDTSFNYQGTSVRKGNNRGKTHTFKSSISHHVDILNSLENTGKIAYIFKKIPLAARWIKGKTLDRAINIIKIAVCRTYLFFGRPVPRPLVRFYVYNLYATKLLNNYTYQGYTGRMVLFNSDRADRAYHQDWLDLVEGEVAVHVVPEADHLAMIKEPYAGIWAKLMSKCLKELQVKGSDHEL